MTHASVRAALVATLAALACGHEPTVPSPMGAAGGIGPLCELGCVETDPNPSAPGVFLGSGVSPDVCISGGYTDADQDGLGDFCEKNLAFAFAPELYYWGFDNVRREPYWVARPLVESEQVLIGYLLSDYRDEGSSSYPCSLPGAPSSCHGHNGDSEAIFLTVYYNWSTQHWVLDHANYSQHGDYPTYAKGPKGYPQMLYYPEHAGSYPRAYVSQGKHANYASQTECNNGGTLDTDTCTEVNTAARVEFSTFWNLGSRTSPRLDCVASRNPDYEYYGSGREECYWTYRNFRGWIPETVGGAEASAYSGFWSCPCSVDG